MGATIVSALATGAATYAARKASPQSTYENYNFGGEPDEDEIVKPQTPQMAPTYLGNQGDNGEPKPGQILAPWQKKGAGLGTGEGMGSYIA